VTQPGPVRPSLARAPPAPHPLPMCPLLLSLSHLDFPRSNLPLPPLSPRGALGFGEGNHRNLDPEVSSLPSSLSLSSLPLPLSSPRPPPPVFPSLRARSPRARPRRLGPTAWARARGPSPPARGRPSPVARRPTLGLVSERELGLHLFPKLILVVELPNTNNWTN
jgi:hypothetical protein